MAKKTAKKTARKPVKKTAGKTKKSARKPVKATRKPEAKRALKPDVAPAPKTIVLNPYLTFDGNCEDAFNFYKSVFGGKFGYVGRFREMPQVEGMKVPDTEGDKIMHISLPISKESILMGSDSFEAFGNATIAGNNFSVSITVPSQAKADKLFNGLSTGGKVTMPMNNTFWGSYFGMLTDKFGIQWMISYDKNPGNKS
jgi:PhnB protein